MLRCATMALHLHLQLLCMAFSVICSCRMTYGNGLSSPTQSVKDIKPQAELHLQVCSRHSSKPWEKHPLGSCKLCIK